MENKLKDNFKISGKVRAILRDCKTGEIVRIIPWQNNLIPNVGLTAIANRLGNIGAKANESVITYGAVGTGTATPQATDTTMETELERKLLATTSVTNQTLTIETFFTSSEAVGTIRKFALFGEDASAAADSGTMFEYIAFASAFAKASTETLTIEIQLTVAYS